MDYSTYTIYELKELCKQQKIRGYGGKNKADIIALLYGPLSPAAFEPPDATVEPLPIDSPPIEIVPIHASATDFFDSSGPFVYVFQRSSHLEPIRPTPSENFWKILEILDTTRPHFLVLENVKNLVRHNSGATYEELKGKLAERGYFHRYRILDTLENNVRFYVSCFKETEAIDTSYMSEKIEESRLSIIMNPSVSKKYVFDNDVVGWLPHETRKTNAVYQYIRLHSLVYHGVKPQQRIDSSYDISLRECFNFDEFAVDQKLSVE
jgi:hypothetical protein